MSLSFRNLLPTFLHEILQPELPSHYTNAPTKVIHTISQDTLVLLSPLCLLVLRWQRLVTAFLFFPGHTAEPRFPAPLWLGMATGLTSNKWIWGLCTTHRSGLWKSHEQWSVLFPYPLAWCNQHFGGCMKRMTEPQDRRSLGLWLGAYSKKKKKYPLGYYISEK